MITSYGLLNKSTYNNKVQLVYKDKNNLYLIIISKESLSSILDDSRSILDTNDITIIDLVTYKALKIPREGTQPSIYILATTKPRTPKTTKQPKRTLTRKQNKPSINYLKQGNKTSRSYNKLTPRDRVLSLLNY